MPDCGDVHPCMHACRAPQPCSASSSSLSFSLPNNIFSFCLAFPRPPPPFVSLRLSSSIFFGWQAAAAAAAAADEEEEPAAAAAAARVVALLRREDEHGYSLEGYTGGLHKMLGSLGWLADRQAAP